MNHPVGSRRTDMQENNGPLQLLPCASHGSQPSKCHHLFLAEACHLAWLDSKSMANHTRGWGVEFFMVITRRLGCFLLLFQELWTCNILQHRDVGLLMGWYARSSKMRCFLECPLSQNGLVFVRRGSERHIQLQLFNPPLLPTIAVMKHLGAIFLSTII